MGIQYDYVLDDSVYGGVDDRVYNGVDDMVYGGVDDRVYNGVDDMVYGGNIQWDTMGNTMRYNGNIQ